MEHLKNTTERTDAAQAGGDKSVERMIWVAAGGLVAAFILAQVLNKKAEAPGGGSGVTNSRLVQQPGEAPYVEAPTDGTTNNMQPGFQHPRAKILNADGEVVPANPAIAEQMRQEKLLAERRREELRLARSQFRAPPPPGLEDKIAPPPGGWPKQTHGKIDAKTSPREQGQPDYVVAAFEEMRARGELDDVLEAQNRSLQDSLRQEGSEPGVGLTQADLDEIRDKKYMVFR